jgi:hypothetical protein
VPSRRSPRVVDNDARIASREREMHFPSEKNAFSFSRGKNSAFSRRVERVLRALRRGDLAVAEPELFLQNS